MKIEVKGLVKNFSINKYEKINAVDDVNVTFNDSGINLLFGESGSGKSTFLKLLYGLIKPDSGEFFLNNQNIDSLNEYDTYYIPQDYGLIYNLTVKENLKLAFNGLIEFDVLDLKINNVFKEEGIFDLLDQKVESLSGGEKAKVAFSRILIRNPKIILLDEPTASIDLKYSLEVYKYIKDLSKECLVIVVSHDERIKEFSNNIYLMDDGKIHLNKEKIEVDSNVKKNENHKNDIRINSKYTLNKIYKKHRFVFIFFYLIVIMISFIFVLINLLQVKNTQIESSIIENSDVNYLYSEDEIESEFLNKIAYYDYSMDFEGAYIQEGYDYLGTLDRLVIDNSLDDGVVCVSDYVLDMMIHTHAIDYLEISGKTDGIYKTVDEAAGETYTYNDYDFTMEYYDTDYEKHTVKKFYDENYLDYEDSIYMMSLDTFKEYYTKDEYEFTGDQNSESSFENEHINLYDVDNSNSLYSYRYTYEDEKITDFDIDISDDEIILLEDYFYGSNVDIASSIDYSKYVGQTVQIDFDYFGESISKEYTIANIFRNSYELNQYSFSPNETEVFLNQYAFSNLYSTCLGDAESNVFDALEITNSYVYTVNGDSYLKLYEYLESNGYSLSTYYDSTLATLTSYVNNMQDLAINLIYIFITIDVVLLILFNAFDYKFTNENYNKLQSFGYLKKHLKKINSKILITLLLFAIPIGAILSVLISYIVNLNIINIVDQSGTYIKYISIYSVLFYIINFFIFIVCYRFVSSKKIKYKN